MTSKKKIIAWAVINKKGKITTWLDSVKVYVISPTKKDLKAMCYSQVGEKIAKIEITYDI